MTRLLTVLLILNVTLVVAQVTVFEQEPNNKPLTANNISPPLILIGEMQNNDQDLYVWEVKDAQTDYFWTLELKGMVDKLTKLDVMQLRFTEDGTGVTGVNSIFSIKHENGFKIRQKNNLLFAPGKYYFGLSYAGGKSSATSPLFSSELMENITTESANQIKQSIEQQKPNQNNYTLTLKKGRKIYPVNIQENNSKEMPASLSMDGNDYSVFYQDKPRWLKFKIKQIDVLNRWQISGSTALGNRISVKLLDATGEELTQVQSKTDGSYRLTDLQFNQGEYFIELNSTDKNTITSIKIQNVGEVVAGQESEPNDNQKQANIVTLGETVSGTINKKNDRDYFKFNIAEELSSHQFSIEFSNLDSAEMKVCITKQGIYEFMCRKIKEDIEFKNIVLESGDYGLLVNKSSENSKYSFLIEDKGIRNTLQEAEPNDRFHTAAPLNAKRIVKGEFSGKESDFFSFEVTGEPQLWTIQANGKNIQNITLYNSAGKSIQDFRYRGENKRARISNLFLMPGTHVISLKGEDSQYLLRAFPTGKPNGNYEVEPNGTEATSMPLSFGKERIGLLQNKADKDFYHFSLDSQEHIHLTITPPVDGSIGYELYWYNQRIGYFVSEIGEPMVFEGLYPIGEFQLKLRTGKQASIASYKVELKRLPVSTCQKDCEPNDSIAQAEMISTDWKFQGTAGTQGDDDWYQIPVFETETKIAVKNNNGDKHSLRLSNAENIAYSAQWDYENKYYVYDIPANEKIYLKLSPNNKPYNFDLLVNGIKPEVKAVKKDLTGVEIKFKGFEHTTIQAYSQYGQTIEGQVTISNTAPKTQELIINSTSNVLALNTNIKSQRIKLSSGAYKTLSLQLRIPSEMYNNQIMRINVTAANQEKQTLEKFIDIRAKTDAEPINSSIHWQIKAELLGGINVASYAMGAKRTDEDMAMNIDVIGRGFDSLFDGNAVHGVGLRYRGNRKNNQDYITIDLAGEKAHEIIGMSLNPLSGGTPQYYPKDFELHLSVDGINFEKIITSQLKPVGIEQSFVLSKPTKARFARLYLLNSYENRKNSMISLGEWKVIASANSVINDNTSFNLAAPKNGGNVIWALPETSNKWDINLITEKKESTYVRSRSKDDWQWVIGFHHQRVAKINKIQWVSPEISEDKIGFDKVQIMVSTTSPVGPWKELLQSNISQTDKNNEFIFNQPVWARYVKFNVGNVKIREYRYLPETIRVFEQPIDSNYHSILGEWGDTSELSIYEKLNPIDFFQEYGDKDLNNNSHADAYDLTTIKQVLGQVQLEEADKPDWYKFKLASNENTLEISLSGEPTIKTVIQLYDENEQVIALPKLKQSHQKIDYKVTLEPNKYYYIKVIEPPRSVIFTWDTSGSTSNYKPLIYRALSQYARDVEAGRDEVNFLPFGGSLLMEKWFGEPRYLQMVLNNYPRNHDSSQAETTLDLAAKALENRQGSKAIVIFTDAITSKDENMWKSLIKVQPQIFSIGIIGNGFGGNPNRQTDLMQAWSRVNNGQFHMVKSAAEVEKAFERVAAKLRQPAKYRLNFKSSYEKPKGPGKLRVTQDVLSQDIAVELILDASGSMLKRLDDKRRINIAKEVLIKAVTEIIPEKTPLALRVFGDKQANSCRTDLAIKLAPLESNKARSIIQKIQAKNLAKTPIADALAKVASDLKSHTGKKIVILVTDGEETCDGNPQEVISNLIEKGVDIRLNIVGFAIGDESLKKQFNQWSVQGGGKYFDSHDSESLKTSIEQALKTPYSVFNQAGELLQEGYVNGKEIELMTGNYTIKIYGSEIKTFANYRVEGEATQTIEL